MIKLSQHEEVVSKFKNLTLTNFRIIATAEFGSTSDRHKDMVGIQIRHISHCELKSKDAPILLLLALLFLGAFSALGIKEPIMIGVGIALAIIFVVLYVTTRSIDITIACPTAKVGCRVGKASFDEAVEFINSVQGFR